MNSIAAAEAEKKWIKQYKDNGWVLINKNGGGSIGNVINNGATDLDDDTIIMFAKNCSSMEDMRRKNRSLYNWMIKRDLKRVCSELIPL